MTRFQARQAMTEARTAYGMNSPQAIEAEKLLATITRAYEAAQQDGRDKVARLFQD